MKKILSLILTLFCVLSLVGCGRSMDDIIKNESSITGVVENAFCISSNCRYSALTVCTRGYMVSFLPTIQMRL